MCITARLIWQLDIHSWVIFAYQNCRRQEEPTAYSWSVTLYELHSEIFLESVHILGMPVLYQLICIACGREGLGVEFKVRLMTR